MPLPKLAVRRVCIAQPVPAQIWVFKRIGAAGAEPHLEHSRSFQDCRARQPGFARTPRDRRSVIDAPRHPVRRPCRADAVAGVRQRQYVRKPFGERGEPHPPAAPGLPPDAWKCDRIAIVRGRGQDGARLRERHAAVSACHHLDPCIVEAPPKHDRRGGKDQRIIVPDCIAGADAIEAAGLDCAHRCRICLRRPHDLHPLPGIAVHHLHDRHVRRVAARGGDAHQPVRQLPRRGCLHQPDAVEICGVENTPLAPPK